tara:strand:+ start:642 stop:782 length:141 start_codon:yes stop_codon:yes gene_type:complete
MQYKTPVKSNQSVQPVNQGTGSSAQAVQYKDNRSEAYPIRKVSTNG